MLLINLLLSAKGTLLLRLDSRSGLILALAFCIQYYDTDGMPKIFRLVPNSVLMTLNSSPSSGFALAKGSVVLALDFTPLIFFSSILSLFLSYSTQLQSKTLSSNNSHSDISSSKQDYAYTTSYSNTRLHHEFHPRYWGPGP